MGFLDKLFGKKQKQSSIEITSEHSYEDSVITNKVNCPYCNNELKTMPTKNKKCPFCGEEMHVKSKLRGDLKVLVTEEQAINIDKEKKNRSTEKKYKYQSGLFLSDIQYEEKRLTWTNKYGDSNRSIRDFIWSNFNEYIAKHPTDYFNLMSTYLEMANFLQEEDKNPFQMLQQARKMELLRYKSEGIRSVEILSYGGCTHCNELNGKKFLITDALRTMPIPNKECEYHNGFCRCGYCADSDALERGDYDELQ